MAKTVPHFLMTVPNTDEGREFFKQFKAFMNKEKFGVKRMGRHTNRKKAMKDAGLSMNMQRDVAIDICEKFVVYVTDKEGRIVL